MRMIKNSELSCVHLFDIIDTRNYLEVGWVRPTINELESHALFNVIDAENELIIKLSEAEKFATEEGMEHNVFFANLIAELNEKV